MDNPFLWNDCDEPTDDAAAVAVQICAQHDNDPAELIEILHDLQRAHGHTPQSVLPEIARALNLSRAEVHGVVSFYHNFRERPAGKVTVKLCRAEACQAMGALDLIGRICGRYGIAPGGTSAGGITVEPVY